MVTKNLAFRISADDSDALKSFAAISKSADREMTKVAQALDDTDTAGKRMADGLKAAAAQIDAELTGVKGASDALRRSLGDDFDRSSAEVDGFVQDLRRAGLTFEEIEADADELAAAIRALDDVRLKNVSAGLDDVDDSVRRVGETTDKTKSVVANFAGNAAQDLPGISDAFGGLNVAVGQFAEYATEGDIAVSGLMKALGPIAIGTGVIAGVEKLVSHLKDIAESKAFNRERVDGFVDAIREGETAVSSLREQILETGKIEVRIGNDDKVRDLLPDLAAVNMNLGDYLLLVDGSAEQVERWAAAQLGVDTEWVLEARMGMFELTEQQKKYLPIIQAVVQEQGNMAAADLEAAIQTQVLMDGLKYAEGQVAAVAAEAAGLAGGMTSVAAEAALAEPPVMDLGVAFGSTALAAGDAEAAAKALEQQLIDLNETVLAQASADLALRNALDSVEDSTKAYHDALKSGDVEKASDAARILEGDLLGVATAAADAADAAVKGLGPLASEAEKAEAKNRAMNAELVAAAKAIAPGSEAYEWINGWISQLGRIPNTVTTRIGTSGQRQTSGGQDVVSRGDDTNTRAFGGPVDAGVPYLVGERGPEIVVPRSAGTVIPNGRIGGDTINLYVSGSVVTERQLIDAVHEGLLRKGRTVATLGL